MKKLKQSAFLLLTLGVLSGQVASAGYYPTDSYKVPWLDPRCETACTASHGSVKARLRIDANMFDGGPMDNTKAKLEFFVNSRKRQEEKIGPLRNVSGPYIGQNKRNRTEVAVDLSIPPSQSKPSGYYSFGYNHAKKKFQERGELQNQDEFLAATSKIDCLRKSQSGNTSATLSWKTAASVGSNSWTIKIKRKNKLALSQKLELPMQPNEERAPEISSCHGPFIASLDGSSEQQVDLRICAMMRDDLLSYTGTFEKIYYYDKRSRKMKSDLHFWGCTYPRLAKLKNNGKIQLIAEDYLLERECWNAREFSSKGLIWGGPLQIWQWRKQKLQNVTREFPAELKKHAKAQLDGNLGAKGDSHIIAYVGDLCLLGETQKALSELKRLDTENTKARHTEILQALKSRGYLVADRK